MCQCDSKFRLGVCWLMDAIRDWMYRSSLSHPPQICGVGLPWQLVLILLLEFDAGVVWKYRLRWYVGLLCRGCVRACCYGPLHTFFNDLFYDLMLEFHFAHFNQVVSTNFEFSIWTKKQICLVDGCVSGGQSVSLFSVRRNDHSHLLPSFKSDSPAKTSPNKKPSASNKAPSVTESSNAPKRSRADQSHGGPPSISLHFHASCRINLHQRFFLSR